MTCRRSEDAASPRPAVAVTIRAWRGLCRSRSPCQRRGRTRLATTRDDHRGAANGRHQTAAAVASTGHGGRRPARLSTDRPPSQVGTPLAASDDANRRAATDGSDCGRAGHVVSATRERAWRAPGERQSGFALAGTPGAGAGSVRKTASDLPHTGGRYWVRTSDLFGVNEARYHCANRPPRGCFAQSATLCVTQTLAHVWQTSAARCGVDHSR